MREDKASSNRLERLLIELYTELGYVVCGSDL